MLSKTSLIRWPKPIDAALGPLPCAKNFGIIVHFFGITELDIAILAGDALIILNRLLACVRVFLLQLNKKLHFSLFVISNLSLKVFDLRL